jgi:hypothetical protein
MCNDPFITYLKQTGYNVIRLPRQDFPPLQLLAGDRKELTSLGALATVISGPSLPPLRQNAPAAPISGQQTGKLSLGVGLTLLGSIVEALGGSKIGLDAQYKSAKSVTFEFTDVLMDSIEIAALDQYLAAADVNPNSRHVGALLEADEVYVVTTTIKSNTITVRTGGERDIEVGLKLPEIQKVVGGELKVSAANNSASSITYKGNTPLVFGFQAIKLAYRDGHYTAFELVDAGDIAARDLLGKQPPEIASLKTDGAFTRMKMG